jgi:serine/threonine protein kinase
LISRFSQEPILTNPLIDQEPIWIADSEQRYECLTLLGEGGMGKVFRAYDHRLKRHVAIKVLKANEKSVSIESQILFIKEAQTTAQLNHPYIIPVYDAGYWENQGFYLVMKEVKGQSLDKVIRAFHENADGWYNPNEKMKLLSAQTWVDFCVILRQVAQAIGFAHKLGALHRDLKPENIMIGQDGEVWVLDWGLARATSQTQLQSFQDLDAVPMTVQQKTASAFESAETFVSPLDTSPSHPTIVQASALASLETFVAQYHPIQSNPQGNTQSNSQSNPRNSSNSLTSHFTFTGLISGTPAYMSPEQAQAVPLDARSDTYALGAILYEILANRPPYLGTNPYEIIAQVLHKEPVSLSSEALIEGSPLLKTAPNSLKKLCMKAISRNINDRFTDGTELAEALKEIERGADLYERAEEAYQEGLLLSQQIQQAIQKLAALELKLEKYKNQRSSEIGLYWGQKLKLEQQIQADRIREMAEYERAVLICQDHHQALLTFAEKLVAQLTEAFYQNRQNAQLPKLEKQLLELKKKLPFQSPMVFTIDQLLKKQKPLELSFLPIDAKLKLIYVDQPMTSFCDEQQKPIFKYEWQVNELLKYDFKIGSYQYDIEYQNDQKESLCFSGCFENMPIGLGKALTLQFPKKIPMGPKLCFIPQGPFRYGSNQGIINEIAPKIIELPSFWIMENPVTYEHYCDFLNDLLDKLGAEKTETFVPISRTTINFGEKAFVLKNHRYEINSIYLNHHLNIIDLKPQRLGINFMNWYHAQAFAAYLREKTGRLWRLPYEWEFEKAARGVDGRLFPWPQILNQPEDTQIKDYERISPYRLWGGVGLMATWCLNPKKFPYPTEELLAEKERMIQKIEEDESFIAWTKAIDTKDFAIKGGGYFNEGLNRSIPYRFAANANRTFADVGIRLVCEVEVSDLI